MATVCEILLVVVACALANVAVVAELELEGSSASYARFQKWNPCTNGSLEFEFKTRQLNGLLLYADDGGDYDFIEIKIVAGIVRFRINLGYGATILSAANPVSNSQWHRLVLSRNGQDTTLTVDGESTTKATLGSDIAFGNISQNSDVFIGGLPTEFHKKLSKLSLPSAAFEPRFRGSVRNLMYSNCSRPKVSPQMLAYQGIRYNLNFDACQMNNPCLNGGICVSTDAGPICDCSLLEYNGLRCEKGREVLHRYHHFFCISVLFMDFVLIHLTRF